MRILRIRESWRRGLTNGATYSNLHTFRPRKFSAARRNLRRGVIGSTTDSGSVSWGSSPCASALYVASAVPRPISYSFFGQSHYCRVRLLRILSCIFIPWIVVWVHVFNFPWPNSMELHDRLPFGPYKVFHASFPVTVCPSGHRLSECSVKLLSHADIENS